MATQVPTVSSSTDQGKCSVCTQSDCNGISLPRCPNKKSWEECVTCSQWVQEHHEEEPPECVACNAWMDGHALLAPHNKTDFCLECFLHVGKWHGEHAGRDENKAEWHHSRRDQKVQPCTFCRKWMMRHHQVHYDDPSGECDDCDDFFFNYCHPIGQ